MEKEITYSRSVSVVLSNICASSTSYFGATHVNKVRDYGEVDLLVPYSAIKLCKEARKKGIKEVTLISGEHPDQFAAVRAKLDLWGFTSFIEYIYTIAELCFLEGLLPVIDVGSLTKEEVNQIRRIASSIVVPLENTNPKFIDKLYHEDAKSVLKRKFETIRYAADGTIPTTIKTLIGIGETVKSRKETFELIARVHEKFGHIQNVMIQVFEPHENGSFTPKKKVGRKDLLDAVVQAKKILPEGIKISVQYTQFKGAPQAYMAAGVNDFGWFDYLEEQNNKTINYTKELAELSKKVTKQKGTLQGRLPIFDSYIMEDWYSRKLAQVLDKYKATLKTTEKVSVD